MQTTLPFPRTHGQAGSNRSQRRWLHWLLIPLIVAVLVGGLWWRTSQSTTAVTTTIVTVSQGTWRSRSAAVARLRPPAPSMLPFQQAGTVTSVEVTIGDTVEAGQTLATIDPARLQLRFSRPRPT